MTLQPTANRTEVLHGSGVRGYETDLLRTQPDQLATETTGGGSVGFGAYGAVVSPGGTGGDTAIINASEHEWGRFVSTRITEFVYRFDVGEEPPISDDIEIGHIKDGVNGNNGPQLRFDTEEFAVGGTTKPATVAQFPHGTYLRIVEDFQGGSTTFYHRANTFTEEVTIDSADVATDDIIVATESQGNADSIQIQWVRESLHFRGEP